MFNVLLQILEDGRLTDSQGRVVDFKNTIIVMTSNLGAHDLFNRKQLGFSTGSSGDVADYEDIKSTVMNQLKKSFRPEFLNRIDEIIVFHQLDREQIQDIAKGMIKIVAERVRNLNIDLIVEESAITLIADEGFDPVYGARPLRRVIQSALRTQYLSASLMAALSQEEVSESMRRTEDLSLKTSEQIRNLKKRHFKPKLPMNRMIDQ